MKAPRRYETRLLIKYSAEDVAKVTSLNIECIELN